MLRYITIFHILFFYACDQAQQRRGASAERVIAGGGCEEEKGKCCKKYGASEDDTIQEGWCSTLEYATTGACNPQPDYCEEYEGCKWHQDVESCPVESIVDTGGDQTSNSNTESNNTCLLYTSPSPRD